MPIIIELLIIAAIPTIFKLINLVIDRYFPKKENPEVQDVITNFLIDKDDFDTDAPTLLGEDTMDQNMDLDNSAAPAA